MRTFSLQSGSNGNAIYVEADGTRLLFDAGISGSAAQLRMAARGRDIRNVDAVIISHDHRDHVACAGVYQRRFRLPIYATHATLLAAMRWCNLGKLTDVRFFGSGDSLRFGRVTVHTIPTSHDAVDGVAFVVECDGKRLAILTDLGCPSETLQRVMESVDAAYLECNYDPAMLESGPYPPHLKKRIKGPGGHLSNHEAAAMLRACGRNRPGWVSVAHLSERNNLPDLAVSTQRAAVGGDYPVHVASRDEVSPVWEV